MAEIEQFVKFSIGDQLFAMPLEKVERVIAAVAVTRVPEVPEAVMGIINLQGTVLPVFNLHYRYGIPAKTIGIKDLIMILSTEKRQAALVVDAVEGITSINRETVVAAREVVSRADFIDGVAKLAEGLILVSNLDRFLTSEEEEQLTRVLSKRSRGKI